MQPELIHVYQHPTRPGCYCSSLEEYNEELARNTPPIRIAPLFQELKEKVLPSEWKECFVRILTAASMEYAEPTPGSGFNDSSEYHVAKGNTADGNGHISIITKINNTRLAIGNVFPSDITKNINNIGIMNGEYSSKMIIHVLLPINVYYPNLKSFLAERERITSISDDWVINRRALFNRQRTKICDKRVTEMDAEIRSLLDKRDSYCNKEANRICDEVMPCPLSPKEAGWLWRANFEKIA